MLPNNEMQRTSHGQDGGSPLISVFDGLFTSGGSVESCGTTLEAGMRTAFVVLSVAVLASVAAASEAQQPPSGNRRAFGFGVGVGAAAMSVGSDSNATLGVSILGRVGIDSGNRFLVVAEFDPLEVDSPVLDESFRAVNVLFAVSVGRSFKVRPALGVQFRSWSGRERVEPSDSGLLLGVDAGPEFRRSERVSLSPEILFRWSAIEVEGSVGSRFIGLQVVASWRY